jgi:broad specificity phosphatase PhoE
MTLTLVRHAEVEERYIGCYNGHLDIGLSKKGLKDAKKLKSYFKASDFDAIFCSDLIRAKETLREFMDSDMVIYTKELREKSWGKHEGLSFNEIIAMGEVEYIDFEQWIDALDGESLETYTKRVEKFLFEYLPSLKKKNILLLTHNGVIKTFIAKVKEIRLIEAFNYKLPYSGFVVYNNQTNKMDIYD